MVWTRLAAKQHAATRSPLPWQTALRAGRVEVRRAIGWDQNNLTILFKYHNMLMLDWKCVLFLQTKASLYSPPSITPVDGHVTSFFFFFLKHLTGIRPLQCVFVTSKIWNHTANKLRFWPWRQTAGAILIPSFGTNSARQTIRIFFMLWIPEVPGRQRENLKQNTVPVPLSLLIYGDKKILHPFFLDCCMRQALLN